MNNIATCRLCDFTKGATNQHDNGLLFDPLHATPHTLAFLSEQQPVGEEGHILVIPKVHHERLEQVPSEIRHQLIDEIALMAQLVRQFHPASNILLNNGKEAGQHEPHLHWHIIPRELNDSIFIDNINSQIPERRSYEALTDRYRRALGQLISE